MPPAVRAYGASDMARALASWEHAKANEAYFSATVLTASTIGQGKGNTGVSFKVRCTEEALADLARLYAPIFCSTLPF